MSKRRLPIYGKEVEEELFRKRPNSPAASGSRKLWQFWMRGNDKRYCKLDAEVRRKFLEVSAAHIDRILAPRKVCEGKGRCGTKPGELLKTQIPIRTDNWQVDRPGYFEADTVASCGESLEGDFVWSVTYTDIVSG